MLGHDQVELLGGEKVGPLSYDTHNYCLFPPLHLKKSFIKLQIYKFKKHKHTVGFFLDLKRDRFSSHLQEVNGLTQRFSFKTDPINGQDSVPYMDGPSPARLEEQRRQRYQTVPRHGSGNLSGCQTAAWDWNKEASCYRKRWDNIVYSLIYLKKKKFSHRNTKDPSGLSDDPLK